MEMVNFDLHTQRQKEKYLMRELGYCYLTVIRRTSEFFIHQFLEVITNMLKFEESIIHDRHSKKWINLTSRQYPLLRESYQVRHQPCFHFHFDDIWWPVKKTNPNVSCTEDRLDDNWFTNDSNYDVPSNIRDFLGKGPKFRIPNNQNYDLLKETKIQLEVLTYKMRYSNTFQYNLNNNNDSLVVPFHKNHVKLPERMNQYQENSLAGFKHEVMNVVEKEVKRMEKDEKITSLRKTVKETRRFLNDHNLVAVKSDKTNRLVITDEEKYKKKSQEMLENTNNYKHRKQSKCKQIETQANRLIRNIGHDKFDRRTQEKLISTGSQPANFVTLIKDHKNTTDTGFPLRPVASTINTPTNKIDWLISRILNQLLLYIPSYIKNTDDLIEKLNNIDMKSYRGTEVFVSLDVVNLYPSIPISKAIRAVIEFAKQFWDSIDHYGLSLEELDRCLSFVSYNYEVQYLDKTYLQIKGCPMGAHFSPPFAIIYMHKIEVEALDHLKINHNIIPQLYARYIDDVIIGPFDHNSQCLQIILNTFNNIDDNI